MARSSGIDSIVQAVETAFGLLREISDGRTIELGRTIQLGGRCSTVAESGARSRSGDGRSRRVAATDPGDASEGRDGRREPIVDVFDEGDHLHVVAEIPGVDPAEVQFRLEGNRLTLHVAGDEAPCVHAVDLPSPVREEEVTSSGRNGVLELKLRKA